MRENTFEQVAELLNDYIISTETLWMRVEMGTAEYQAIFRG